MIEIKQIELVCDCCGKRLKMRCPKGTWDFLSGTFNIDAPNDWSYSLDNSKLLCPKCLKRKDPIFQFAKKNNTMEEQE